MSTEDLILKKRVLGLTGCIGSGKSFVASIFRKLGSTVIDADRIAHDVLEYPRVRRLLVKKWGRRILNGKGKIDRSKLSEIVFCEESQVRKLNRIMHPEILKDIAKKVKTSKNAVVVIDAPVLFEAGADEICDKVAYVHASARSRRSRVSERGWSGSELARRERHQLGAAEKRKLADYVIDNDGPRSSTVRQVRKILSKLKGG